MEGEGSDFHRFQQGLRRMLDQFLHRCHQRTKPERFGDPVVRDSGSDPDDRQGCVHACECVPKGPGTVVRQVVVGNGNCEPASPEMFEGVS